MTLDRYGHLIPGDTDEYGRRMDHSIFGNSDDAVRKLLENPTYEEIHSERKSPEDDDPQGLSSK